MKKNVYNINKNKDEIDLDLANFISDFLAMFEMQANIHENCYPVLSGKKPERVVRTSVMVESFSNSGFCYMHICFEKMMSSLLKYAIKNSPILENRYTEKIKTIAKKDRFHYLIDFLDTSSKRISKIDDVLNFEGFINFSKYIFDIKSFDTLGVEKDFSKKVLPFNIDLSYSYAETKERYNLLKHRGRYLDEIYLNRVKKNTKIQSDKEFVKFLKSIHVGLIHAKKLNNNEFLDEIKKSYGLSPSAEYSQNTLMTFLLIILVLISNLRLFMEKKNLLEIVTTIIEVTSINIQIMEYKNILTLNPSVFNINYYAKNNIFFNFAICQIFKDMVGESNRLYQVISASFINNYINIENIKDRIQTSRKDKKIKYINDNIFRELEEIQKFSQEMCDIFNVKKILDSHLSAKNLSDKDFSRYFKETWTEHDVYGEDNKYYNHDFLFIGFTLHKKFNDCYKEMFNKDFNPNLNF